MRRILGGSSRRIRRAWRRGSISYAYAGNDPINNVDPSGLAAEKALNGAKDAGQSLVDGVRNTASDLYNDPAGTLSSMANSFPQTRIEGEALSGLAAVGTLAENAARGLSFERTALSALGLTKNTGLLTNIPGVAGATIPDALATGLVAEVKDASYVTNSLQLRLQAAYANWQGVPLNLIVNQGSRVSAPVVDAVQGTGGTIMRFNPVTKTFSPY